MNQKTKLQNIALGVAGFKKQALIALGIFTLMILTSPTMMAAAAQTAAAASDFIQDALGMLGVVVIAIGAGLGIWGIVNLLEGYGNDNPGAKSQGIKQLMAGGGLILIGIFVPAALQVLLDIN